ncbi:helix-turn-helix domain-containing protein [Natrinema salsiterrestre]|uniref:Helix-turn-helix domain-containing protein n=1 Tax=Natrinema salsiterrestre TaxID=2950540 RepID=A0A9Q4L287_9EURY|nr:helix-turn-helix domain-containing protein [Natrinema salsiterrestre]MDF9745513.1 helix-turn-helix domain-containing protein [Natrinema salsiterrestre]
MALEASFTTTEGEFPLAEIFTEFPASQVELDRVVPTNEVIIPYFWLRGVENADAEMTAIDHPGIEEIRVVDTVDSELFVRIEWDFEYESVLTAVLETEVALVTAIGREGKWTFEIRGDSQQDVSDFQSYCRDNDIPVELVELHALSPLHSGDEYDLTDPQREALILAYARGYFDSPRKANQGDVADELGITRQAFASRLRRGIRRLLTSTLIESSENADTESTESG